MIVGDAATATQLDDDPQYRLGRFTIGTQGADADKIACNDDVLFMNGCAVFNFAAVRVPASIRESVTVNRLGLEDIDRFSCIRAVATSLRRSLIACTWSGKRYHSWPKRMAIPYHRPFR